MMRKDPHVRPVHSFSSPLLPRAPFSSLQEHVSSRGASEPAEAAAKRNAAAGVARGGNRSREGAVGHRWCRRVGGGNTRGVAAIHVGRRGSSVGGATDVGSRGGRIGGATDVGRRGGRIGGATDVGSRGRSVGHARVVVAP